ncbi:MAG: CPBP family intramembrane glutamic endopeptidase [Balneolales bacterium]
MNDIHQETPKNDRGRPSRDSATPLTGTSLLILSLGSLLAYLLITLLILHFLHEAPLASLFDHGFNIKVQGLAGAVCGLAAALLIGLVMFRTPVSVVLRDYMIVDAVADMRFSGFDRVQVSLFAGIGEELLFRGALQPLLGIWVTSVLFVGLHGYFKFASVKHLAFGGMMFALSVGLGSLYEWAGLAAAMAAHAVYDFVMLQIGHAYGFGTRRISDGPR